MKKKDTIYLVIALAIFVVMGVLIYSHFAGKSGSKGVTQVEVVDPIASTFNQSAISSLNDPTQAINFLPTVSLDGLGNSAPFGPLR